MLPRHRNAHVVGINLGQTKSLKNRRSADGRHVGASSLVIQAHKSRGFQRLTVSRLERVTRGNKTERATECQMCDSVFALTGKEALSLPVACSTYAQQLAKRPAVFWLLRRWTGQGGP